MQPSPPPSSQRLAEHGQGQVGSLFTSRSGVATLAFVVGIAVVVRWHRLAEVHSWFDESLGWRMSQFSFAEIIERSERNVHPPFHFLLLSTWRSVFGDSILSLRSYGLMWGVGTVIGSMSLASAILVNAKSPLDRLLGAGLAGLLVALSPLHIHWSQQIKMYSLGTCLTVWTSWLLVTWLQTRLTSRLIAYVPLAAALSLQHHYGAFTVFAQLTYLGLWGVFDAFSKQSRGNLLEIALTGWATFSLWALWLPSFLAQRALVKNGYWIREFAWQDVINIWSQMLTADTAIRVDSMLSLAIAEAVLVVLLGLFLKRDAGSRFLGWLVLLPFVVAVAWSLIDQNIIVSRFFINADVCLLTGIAVFVANLPFRPLKSILSVALIGAFSFLAHSQRNFRDTQAAVPGMPEAIAFLDEVRGQGEAVLVCNPMLYLNVCIHGRDLTDVYAFDPGYSFPHFQGAPVMRDEEYFGVEDLERTAQTWVWTVDAEKWLGGTWRVRLPSGWKMNAEHRIQEWYGVLVIRSYQHHPDQ